MQESGDAGHQRQQHRRSCLLHGSPYPKAIRANTFQPWPLLFAAPRPWDSSFSDSPPARLWLRWQPFFPPHALARRTSGCCLHDEPRAPHISTFPYTLHAPHSRKNHMKSASTLLISLPVVILCAHQLAKVVADTDMPQPCASFQPERPPTDKFSGKFIGFLPPDSPVATLPGAMLRSS